MPSQKYTGMKILFVPNSSAGWLEVKKFAKLAFFNFFVYPPAISLIILLYHEN
jgi:hypothetical protein